MPVTLQTQAVEALLGTVMGQLSQDKSVDLTQGAQRGTPKSWGKLRFLAQVRLTFLVCEGQDGLYVIDQHAAAERVAFAKLLTQYQARAMTAQSLLFPVMVDSFAQGDRSRRGTTRGVPRPGLGRTRARSGASQRSLGAATPPTR
ncbi:MAG: hypothetical protein QM784_13715 [Polyangiaceae bacterium]